VADLLLVDADLLARGRIEAAATGTSVTVASSASPPPPGDFSLVVVDLDRGGRAALAWVDALRGEGFEGRVVGFFSHVDEEAGRTAAEAGITVFPRGRFWRELPRLLEG